MAEEKRDNAVDLFLGVYHSGIEAAAQAAEITRLLRAWGAGDPAALEQLVPLVYRQLRRVAQRHMRRESPGKQGDAAMVTLETTQRTLQFSSAPSGSFSLPSSFT